AAQGRPRAGGAPDPHGPGRRLRAAGGGAVRRPHAFGLRARLTLWHIAAMAAVLAIYAATVFVVVSRGASRGLDERLRADFKWPSERLERMPGGGIGPYDGTDSGASRWLQVWSPDGTLLYN